MHFGFRVATDPCFGAGHIARCSALAGALRENVTLFLDPTYLGARPFAWAAEIVQEDSVESASFATTALAEGRIDALIVDGYSIDEQSISRAAAEGFVAAFRDSSDYGAEMIAINPNPGAMTGPNVLSGPAYMPLPGNFALLNSNASGKTKAVLDHILVAFGARDSVNRTMTALDGIAGVAGNAMVTVVLGEAAPHRQAVCERLSKWPRAELKQTVDGMIQIYDQVDLAIGAPGVSQFERACCGVPAILVAQNERQEGLCRAWAETGAVVQCGPEPASVSDALKRCLSEPAAVHRMRDRGMSLVDGMGAVRLADALKARLVH